MDEAKEMKDKFISVLITDCKKEMDDNPFAGVLLNLFKQIQQRIPGIDEIRPFALYLSSTPNNLYNYGYYVEMYEQMLEWIEKLDKKIDLWVGFCPLIKKHASELTGICLVLDEFVKIKVNRLSEPELAICTYSLVPLLQHHSKLIVQAFSVSGDKMFFTGEYDDFSEFDIEDLKMCIGLYQ